MAVSDSLDAFTAALATVGFVPSDDADVDPSLDKIALYAIDRRVKHAALQMPSGLWRSKMGKSEDIEHDLHAVEGPLYGVAAAILQKQR